MLSQHIVCKLWSLQSNGKKPLLLIQHDITKHNFWSNMGMFCKMECSLVRLLGLYYMKEGECSTQSFLVGKLNVNICFSGIYKFMAWQVVMIHPWHCLLLTHCMGIVCIGDPGKAHVMCEWLNLAQKHPLTAFVGSTQGEETFTSVCRIWR
jgi:hypothetical protein